jgi:hypothetical protein
VCQGGGDGGACTPPETARSNFELLNEPCTNATCVPFDNCARLGMCGDAAMPNLISPPDGGV